MNRNFKDLTGQVFGRLTVECQVESPIKTSRWLCRCECGNTSEVYSTNLKSGHISGCGCRSHGGGLNTKLDLSGLRFGALIVHSRAVGASKKGSAWICGCDCGMVRLVVSNKALRRASDRCACAQSKAALERTKK